MDLILCNIVLYRTLLSLPDTSTTECHFCSGPDPSFSLELFLYSSPVAYWTPSDLGDSSSISFCIFILFMGFSRKEYWSGLPFPLQWKWRGAISSHILPELFTMTCPSWVALHGMAHSLTELCKTLYHDKAVTCEGVGLKRKQCSAVVVSGGECKVWCCKEQYCIGTWNVRPMNQGKWDVVKQATSGRQWRTEEPDVL